MARGSRALKTCPRCNGSGKEPGPGTRVRLSILDNPDKPVHFLPGFLLNPYMLREPEDQRAQRRHVPS